MVDSGSIANGAEIRWWEDRGAGSGAPGQLLDGSWELGCVLGRFLGNGESIGSGVGLWWRRGILMARLRSLDAQHEGLELEVWGREQCTGSGPEQWRT